MTNKVREKIKAALLDVTTQLSEKDGLLIWTTMRYPKDCLSYSRFSYQKITILDSDTTCPLHEDPSLRKRDYQRWGIKLLKLMYREINLITPKSLLKMIGMRLAYSGGLLSSWNSFEDIFADLRKSDRSSAELDSILKEIETLILYEIPGNPEKGTASRYYVYVNHFFDWLYFFIYEASIKLFPT